MTIVSRWAKSYLGAILGISFVLVLLSFAVPTGFPNLAKQSSATTILFADNYTNSGWHQVGSSVTVNSLFFRSVVQFNNAAGGDSVTENRIVKRLPTALPSNSWTMDFDYKFTASSNPTDILVALTTTIKDPQLQPTSGDFLYVEHGNGVDQLYVHGPGGTATAGIPISPNTQYYVRVEKTPTLITLDVFSDSARTVQVAGSPTTLAIASTDYNGNLKFLQHDACLQCGDSRTLTAQIDNMNIYSSIQTIFKTGYHSPVWTQIGSEVTANSIGHPKVAYFNGAAGGDSIYQNRILKHLPTALPSDNWTFDFGYEFTQSSIPTDIIVALTTTSNDPQLQPTSGDFLYVEHGNGVDQLYVHGPGGTATAGIPISPNTQYYVRVVKNPTLLTLEIFSDKARTQQIAGSPVTLAIASTDYNGNLKFIQHDACLQCGDSRTLTAQINNTLIYAP